MPGITDLDITYGSALAPSGFHRVTRLDGNSAELNKGVGSAPSYLWYHESESKGTPIVDIRILHGDEQLPGFEKVQRCILKGSEQQSYICFSRGTDVDPIGMIRVLYGEERPEEGFERIDKSLVPSGESVFLAVKRVSKDGPSKWSGYSLAVGDFVDVRDTIGKWRVGQIIDATETAVRIHYQGWQSRWDEDVSRDSARLAEYTVHTQGKDTGWEKRQQGLPWDISAAQIQSMLQRLNAHFSGEAVDERFWKAEVPVFLEKALTSTFSDLSVLPDINRLIQRLLEILIIELQSPAPIQASSVQLMNRIFNNDSLCTWYYNTYGYGTSDDFALNSSDLMLNGPFAKFLPDSRGFADQSKLYVTNLNFFGSRGGYDAILARVDPSREPHCSLSELQAIVSILSVGADVYVDTWRQDYFERFQALFFSRLLNLSNEDLKEVQDGDKDLMENILSDLEKLLHATLDEFPLHERLETFQVSFCKRLLTSPFLNLRIRGMQLMSDVIEMTRRREVRKVAAPAYYYSNIPAKPEPTMKWLNSAWLTEWLATSDFLEVALGDREALERYNLQSTHMELVKRCEELLLFLSASNRVASRHIDLLWGATVNQPELQRRAVYKQLQGLTVRLPMEIVMHLARRLETVPPQDIDESYIELVQGVAEGALAGKSTVAQHDSESSIGITMLTALAEGAVPVPRVVREKAFDALATVLSKPAARAFLVHHAERCIKNLRNDIEPTNTFRFLQKIIEALSDIPTYSHSVVTKETLISHLQTTHQLLNVCLEELDRFLNAAQELTTSQGISGTAIDTLIVGSSPYSSGLSLRLDFFKFVLEFSPLEFEFAQVKHLWNRLVGNPLSPSDPELFIKWLASTCPDEYVHTTRRGIFPCFSDRTVMSIYEKLFGNAATAEDGVTPLDYHTLSREAYVCVEKYFRYVNGRQRVISNASHAQYFVVESSNLIGPEVILKAILDSKDDEVVRLAGEFFVNLHVKLSTRINKRDTWDAFTRRCMEIASRNSAGDAPNMQAVSRVLSLLTRFLEDIKKPTAMYSGGYPTRTDEQRVTVFYKKETPGSLANSVGSKSVSYVFKRGAITVGNLRARVAQDFKYPPNQVRLLNGTRAVIPTSQDNMLLERVQITSYADVILLLKPEEDTVNFTPSRIAQTVDEDPNSDQMYPRKILSDSSQYLDLLFQLLTVPEAMDQAWKLLELLPTNTAMQQELASLEGAVNDQTVTSVPWDSILVPNSALRLLYKLKIIEKFVRPAMDPLSSQEAADAAKQWYQAFTRTGGVQHLLKLFLTCDVDAMCNGPLMKSCLASLLQMLTLFVLPEEDVEEKTPAKPTTVQPTSHDDDDANMGSDDDDDEFPKLQKAAKASTALVAVQPTRTFVREVVDVSTIMGENDVTQVARRLLTVMHSVALTSSCGTGENDEQAKKEKSRRSRQARMEEYYRTSTSNNTQGAATSTAVDMMGWNDDSDEQTENLSVEAQVVKNAISLLVAMTLTHTTLLDVVLGYSELSDALRYSLLRAPEKSLRTVVTRGILRLCEKVDNAARTPAQQFVALFLPFVDEANHFPNTCFEFFSLLAKLMVARDAVNDVTASALARKLASWVISHPTVELSEEDHDVMLRGVLVLLNASLAALSPQVQHDVKLELGAPVPQGSGLTDELFEQCLFAFPHTQSQGGAVVGPRPPKCKNVETRAAAFDALFELARNCPENFTSILRLVSPHHTLGEGGSAEATSALSSYHFMPKSKTGYVGLKNPGCVCYMNSSMQQFFMVPAFRQAVLELSDIEGDPAESILFQLQDMFAHLQESEKAYYDPKPFCHAFKDWEGQPTDVSVQQDASEFIGMFFQHIEGLIMGTKFENILKDCFGGVLSNELIAEPGRYSERAEPFYFISIPVKGNKTLDDGLKQYIAGETVDYTWETTTESGEVRKESVPSIKRVSIKAPPKHLIIHLKRFEFDFETMQQAKVNDRFEFPPKLDLFPYTAYGREGARVTSTEEEAAPPLEIQRGEFQYELRGVVVHMGTANSGHYYSYIREREGNGGWFEFNDSYVAEFDPEELEEECFGGEETISYGYRTYSTTATTSSYSSYQSSATQNYSRDKIRNAFLVVYDQVPSQPCEAVVASDNQRSVTSRYRARVPESVMAGITKENMEFWRAKNVFSVPYYEFMSKFVMLNHGNDQLPSDDAIQLACKFTLGTLVSAHERGLLIEWASRLKVVIETHPAGSEWLLATMVRSNDVMTSLLLGIEDKEMRHAVMDLILACVHNLRHQFDAYIDALPASPADLTSLDFTDDAANDTAGVPIVVRFIEKQISMLFTAQKLWRRIAQYFKPLVMLATDNSKVRSYMLRRGYLARLASLFLANDTPYPELVGGAEPAKSKYRAMTDGYTSADCTSLLSLMTLLIRGAEFPESETTPPTSLLPMETASRVEIELISSPVFLYRLSRQVKNTSRKTSMTPLFTHLLWHNRELSDVMIDVIIQSIKKDDYLELKVPFRTALIVIKMTDPLNSWRTEILTTRIAAEITEGCGGRYVYATDTSLQMFARMTKASQAVRNWLSDNPSTLSWADRYLNIRKQGMQPNGSLLYKPKKTNTGTTGYSNTSYQPTSRFVFQDVASVLASAMRGEELEESYDSDDDPRQLEGKRVRVRWAQEKFYAGVVVYYDERTDMHHIKYDDGDEKDYRMSEKVWRFDTPL